jgi:trimethylamine-N-oxide reductase (cytochrome c), cytochrome c-type subunit TorC
MSADTGPQDRGGEDTSGISRREVLLTVGGVTAAVVAGALAWGALELFVNQGHAVGSAVNVTYPQVVMVLGTLACVLGVILCIRTARTRFDAGATPRKDVNIGVARLPGIVFARLVALMAFIILPAAAVFLANYHPFQGVHEVRGCASCHVMLPMVNDMQDPGSETLAAQHFKNKWIADDQCFHCHSDYGLGGNLEAKLTGFRHLARYTTRTYHEPIKARVKFDNKNCLHCHDQTPKFVAVESHVTERESLTANQTKCIDCHGDPHPTAEQRTPGSSDYSRLMEKMK